jgi:hypothetical protein
MPEKVDDNVFFIDATEDVILWNEKKEHTRKSIFIDIVLCRENEIYHSVNLRKGAAQYQKSSCYRILRTFL